MINKTSSENLPTMNRRSLLLGLAAASTVAASAGGTVASASNQRPKLLSLGDKLYAAEAEYIAAYNALIDVILDWSPHWPVAPDQITEARSYAYRNLDLERDLRGYGAPRIGEDKTRRVWHSKDLLSEIHRAEEQVERSISKKSRAALEKAIKNDHHRLVLAKKYEADCEHIRNASGCAAAKGREKAAVAALKGLMFQIMAEPASNMTDALIQAQALTAWGKTDEIFTIGSEKWAPQLAASILRLAQPARNVI
ncbi:hypothetical protein [Phyllobacterium meliloti]|uniref:hypothetical protein n=1 Tax=Phyllobacterium meliloti TaxID=555317 RepID=UPI001D14CD57|nr:hypothetical protein [Phyllobacterium sp. T1293]UGX86163.1 hypothetical protein LLE53_017325 [Phyllobacterium sp. T1293]